MSLKDIFLYHRKKEKNFEIKPSASFESPNNKTSEYVKPNISEKDTKLYETGSISKSLEVNLNFINDAFDVKQNFDFVIRSFKIKLGNKFIDAFMVFYDGLVNSSLINRDILNPLMVSGLEKKSSENLEDIIYDNMISQAPLDKKYEMKQVIQLVEFGNCAVFAEGCECAFVSDVKGWSGRDVGEPITEAVLSGPQEAFTEKIMSNIGLIRKILKDSNLVAEKVEVGKKSKTPCAVMYINGMTNKSLVGEVRKRLTNLKIDYIFSSTDIEMLIEESTYSPLPQILKTERPDRAAAMLADGKVIVIVQGSPFVLVLPSTATDLIEASEDNYVRLPEANFMRTVRVIGILTALFLPGLFLAVTLYHHETIPTDLLLAIEATREQVPFPIALELILMELSFELIKEASIRIPSPIGSTLGIVGGLILGQAAVSANLVSPILIIIVSIGGLGAFAAPNISILRGVSVLKFVFIFLGAIAGFVGIAAGIFVGLIMLCAETSVGVPYFSTLTHGKGSIFKSLFVPPIWKKEHRPSDLDTQSIKKQPHISRKWRLK